MSSLENIDGKIIIKCDCGRIHTISILNEDLSLNTKEKEDESTNDRQEKTVGFFTFLTGIES